MSAAEQDALVGALQTDYTEADLTAADRAMLDYAITLTCDPGDIGVEDISTLRVAGFSDQAIHDICSVTAYFAFVNRIADGLGVELEGDILEDVSPL